MRPICLLCIGGQLHRIQREALVKDFFSTSIQTGDIVTGQCGVPVTDRVEEVHRYGLESVTSPFLLGAERRVIHWVQRFKFDAVIVMTAQVRSCVRVLCGFSRN